MISTKVSYGKKGFKNFIGYKDDDKIKPFCIMLPKVSGCVKCFDETKCKYFLIQDKKLLKTCNKLWGKINNII